jgi:hypothetical protein
MHLIIITGNTTIEMACGDQDGLCQNLVDFGLLLPKPGFNPDTFNTLFVATEEVTTKIANGIAELGFEDEYGTKPRYFHGKFLVELIEHNKPCYLRRTTSEVVHVTIIP